MSSSSSHLWARPSYSDHLRSSAYVMLHNNRVSPGGEASLGPHVMMPGDSTRQPQSLRTCQAVSRGPQSLLQSLIRASPQSSLPYMSSSLLVEPPGGDKATELEEYAKSYEARRSTRRKSSRGSNFAQKQKRHSLHEDNKKKDVWALPGDHRDSARRFVSYNQATASSAAAEAAVPQEGGTRAASSNNCYVADPVWRMGQEQQAKQETPPSGGPRYSEDLIYQNVSEYISLPPEPRDGPRDLKRFPLQTYSSIRMTGVDRPRVRQPCQRQYQHQQLECSMPPLDSSLILVPQSKSVPNLRNRGFILERLDHNEEQEEAEEARDERDQQQQSFTYLDPDKRLRVTDNTLKLIQKQALLEYYERHHQKKKKTSCPESRLVDSGFYSPTDQHLGATADSSPVTTAVTVHQEGVDRVQVGVVQHHQVSQEHRTISKSPGETFTQSVSLLITQPAQKNRQQPLRLRLFLLGS